MRGRCVRFCGKELGRAMDLVGSGVWRKGHEGGGVLGRSGDGVGERGSRDLGHGAPTFVSGRGYYGRGWAGSQCECLCFVQKRLGNRSPLLTPNINLSKIACESME